MERDAKIYVAGHKGMVGSAIKAELEYQGYSNLLLRTHGELDLCDQRAVFGFFQKERPDYVFLAAARVGGIMANIEAPAEFLYENLMIECNVIHASCLCGVKKLLFLASSCAYPRLAPQPMKEEYLLDGKLEPTNEGYALAKISGLKMCQLYKRQYGTDYISVMPCNVYGPRDDFDPVRSHVAAAMIRKFHAAASAGARRVELWGTGGARRELLFARDLAEACLYLMNGYSGSDFFNVGTGSDISIRELAGLVAQTVGYGGEIVFDAAHPDGMPQKLMDCGKLAKAGWKYHTGLEEGLALTYRWYLENVAKKESLS